MATTQTIEKLSQATTILENDAFSSTGGPSGNMAQLSHLSEEGSSSPSSSVPSSPGSGPISQGTNLANSPPNASPIKKGSLSTAEKKRVRVTKACIYCQRSHVSCDAGRPCKRCQERGLAANCSDAEAKRRGRKRQYPSTESNATSTGNNSSSNTAGSSANSGGDHSANVGNDVLNRNGLASGPSLNSLLNHNSTAAPSLGNSGSFLSMSSLLAPSSSGSSPFYPHPLDATFSNLKRSPPNPGEQQYQDSIMQLALEASRRTPPASSSGSFPSVPVSSLLSNSNPSDMSSISPPFSLAPPLDVLLQHQQQQRLLFPPHPFPSQFYNNNTYPMQQMLGFPLNNQHLQQHPNNIQNHTNASSGSSNSESTSRYPASLMSGALPFSSFGQPQHPHQSIAPSFLPRTEVDVNKDDDVQNLSSEIRSDFFIVPTNELEWDESKMHAVSNQYKRMEFFQHVYQVMNKKLGDEEVAFDIWKRYLSQLRSLVTSLRDQLNRDAVDRVKSDLNSYLNTFKPTFEQIVTPTVILERCGVVHYVNSAYTAVTGFSVPLPSPTLSFAWFSQLSPNSCRIFASEMRKVYMDTKRNSISFPCSLLQSPPSNQHISAKEEKYIDGLICITIKRDFLGLPLLLIANFLPFETPKDNPSATQ